MPRGVVKKVVEDKGFGFIESNGEDLFFHCSSIADVGFEELRVGTQVDFQREDGPRGARAVSIRPISGAPLAAVEGDQQGVIKKVVSERGFGFIEANGSDLFFHCSQVRDTAFEDLREGQSVQYSVGRGPHGPRAENVRPVSAPVAS